MMTLYGVFFLGYDEISKPADHEIKHGTLKTITNNPQIVEGVTTKGVPIYIRFKDGTLTCRNKKTNEMLCQGNPFLFKDKMEIPIKDIEFYVEMYSKFSIQFV